MVRYGSNLILTLILTLALMPACVSLNSACALTLAAVARVSHLASVVRKSSSWVRVSGLGIGVRVGVEARLPLPSP